MLREGELANGSFDACFMPRESYTTGDIDIHEIGILADGRPVFVNTKYSCLATTDPVHSFRPLWRPDFISKLTGEDRCHLNGLMADGAPAYVTAVSQTDVLSGWRARREHGGGIIEVATGRIVTDELSMPHSSRVVDGRLYAIDSGRGQVIAIDPETVDARISPSARDSCEASRSITGTRSSPHRSRATAASKNSRCRARSGRTMANPGAACSRSTCGMATSSNGSNSTARLRNCPTSLRF